MNSIAPCSSDSASSFTKAGRRGQISETYGSASGGSSASTCCRRSRNGSLAGRHPDSKRAPFQETISSWKPLSSRSEEHTSELQSRENLVCRLLLEKKKTNAAHSIPSH